MSVLTKVEDQTHEGVFAMHLQSGNTGHGTLINSEHTHKQTHDIQKRNDKPPVKYVGSMNKRRCSRRLPGKDSERNMETMAKAVTTGLSECEI